MYVSRNNVNVRSETLLNVCLETLLSENSYYVVTSQLIYNADKLVGFYLTKAFT